MGWQYQAGASGTVTLPAGAVIMSIRAESHDAAGSVAILGGTAIPCNGAAAPAAHVIMALDLSHGQCAAEGATKTVVFTNTVSYYVEYIT
jgi:hypothetical protein